MIERDEVLPLLVAACPSLVARWEEMRDDDLHLDDDGTRLHYADAGAVVRHLVERLGEGDTDEVRAALGVVERLHVEGDAYVRELATIGYLEDLQGASARHPGCSPADVERLLGPQSLRWWRGLDRFWSGRAPAVEATDADVHRWWRRGVVTRRRRPPSG